VISDASKALREVLELNSAVLPAYQGLSILHLLRGELDQALALVEKAYALFPSPGQSGLIAGVLMRIGDTRRAEELIA